MNDARHRANETIERCTSVFSYPHKFNRGIYFFTHCLPIDYGIGALKIIRDFNIKEYSKVSHEPKVSM